MNLRALFSIFIEKRLLRRDSNPQLPAFKAVALHPRDFALLKNALHHSSTHHTVHVQESGERWIPYFLE